VEAKGLLAGHLFAARELSPEAERELERPGRSIAVYAGDGFVSALLTAGVGVVTAAAPRALRGRPAVRRAAGRLIPGRWL
jgi:hypothetical protein